MSNVVSVIEQIGSWKAPALPKEIPHGDMPGDKVQIEETHIAKAGVIFPQLIKGLLPYFKENPYQRAVVTVCGGSGVGKSEIASLLSYYLNKAGIGSYTLSGDNYPHKIPQYNDAERLHVFREGALKGMIKDGTYTKERFEIIHKYAMEGDDANKEHTKEYDWYESYLKNGKEALKGYLGTSHEIGFDEISEIISQFKSGKDEIFLKRMGRSDTELWYDKVDFSQVNVLVIEWTHGNSDNYSGIDVPILLNSTPQETLAHRRSRNRDGATDSPFTTLVLELEQAMLESQAHKAKIIVSKSGELLSFEAYQKLMDASRTTE
jgi:alpha-galactosidase